MAERLSKRDIWRGRIYRYAPLILWVGVIFVASSTTGSMPNTSRIIRPLLLWLFPNAPEEIITIYHGYIRKSAHFIEYAILGFFASRALWGSARGTLRRYWYAVALLIVISTASLDEFYQSFNPARTSTVFDVLLDSAGGLTVIATLFICRMLKPIGPK